MNNLIKYIKGFRILKFIIERVAYLWFGFWHILFYFFKVNQKKIVITNFYGKGYGDNPKYIVEELLKKDLNLDIVWIVNDLNYKLPKGIRKCKKYSVKSIYEFMTSKIWIDNCRKYYFYNIFKKSSTVYIQTWHGGISMKKIEKEAESNLNNSYILSAKHDSQMIDYFISGSSWQTDDIKRNFWYTGRILEIGLPRNDVLLKKNNFKDKILETYNLPKKCKLLLYAPTFRSNNKIKFMDFKLLLNSLKKRFGGEWVILLRLHPNIKDIEVDLPLFVKNVTSYDDSQQLISASDILITDYSSIMFDMMLLNKPIFIYANDISYYVNDRNFKFQFNELPFRYAEDDENLSKIIINFDKNKYNHNLENFKNKLKLYDDGKASSKVACVILNYIN